MQTLHKSLILFISLITLSTPAFAANFSLSSRDIKHGEFMNKAQEFQGFGCTGNNQSPQLSWQGAPEGTAAFAITAYDPDAPTGSGWWHWQIVNIPAEVTALAAGSGSNRSSAPKGSSQVKNDYGVAGFGGACPPQGNGAHRYKFTIHALSQKIQLPENASGALAGYMINANTIATASLVALYKR